MEKVNLQCPADEWYLARIYNQTESSVGKMDQIKKEKLKEVIKPIVFTLAVLLFGSGIVAIFSDPITRFIAGILILGLFIIGFVWTSRVLKEHRNYADSYINHPKRDEEVTLYELSKEGISINHYNDKEYAYFFKWDDIKYAEIKDMEVKKFRNERQHTDLAKMKQYLKREFEKVRKIIPDFQFEEKISHFDKRSIYIQTNQNRLTVLPIPPTWERSGLADQFIKFVQIHVDVDDLVEKEDYDLVEQLFPGFYNKYFERN